MIELHRYCELTDKYDGDYFMEYFFGFDQVADRLLPKLGTRLKEEEEGGL